MIKTIYDKESKMIQNLLQDIQYHRCKEPDMNPLIDIILENLENGNKHMLVSLYHQEIQDANKFFKSAESRLSEKEYACIKLGELQAFCKLIEKIGTYDKCVEKYFDETFRTLKEGDKVYYLCNDHVQKTNIKEIRPKDGRIKIEYYGYILSKFDYAKTFFPISMKIELVSHGKLEHKSSCVGCPGFKKGKCIYGFSCSVKRNKFKTLNNRIAVHIDGIPNEVCSYFKM